MTEQVHCYGKQDVQLKETMARLQKNKREYYKILQSLLEGKNVKKKGFFHKKQGKMDSDQGRAEKLFRADRLLKMSTQIAENFENFPLRVLKMLKISNLE